VDGITWGSVPGKTIKEYCYHCLNVKKKEEVCGNSGSKNYDNFLDSEGNPMPWLTEATYEEGQVIQIKSHLHTHHYGHCEVKACANVQNPTQDCFDANPLTYVYDPGFAYGAPADPLHPEYGHYADAKKTYYTHKFKLPKGVSGSKVLLQYHYITANSCNPPGYLNYPWPKKNWWQGPYLGNCQLPYPRDGQRPGGAPEQFWNCAQISITPRKTGPTTSPVSSSPTKSLAPSVKITSVPTKRPVVTSSPTAKPTRNPAPPSGGMTATTTRYWDCAGGTCGCAYLPDHLEGNHEYPAHCYSNSLFEAPPDNIHGAKFYGTAAVSKALGGDDWLGTGCGKCWKVTGTCNTKKCKSGKTTLVLRGANFCPPEATHCDSGAHFDIAAPGFDVNGYSLSNNCKKLEPTESAGFEACSMWMIGPQDPSINCECKRFKNNVLRKGCENFFSLGWDNPIVEYEEVTCPNEVLSPLGTPCWKDNGNTYPKFLNTPETCLSPSGEKTPTSSPIKTISPAPSKEKPPVKPYCNWGHQRPIGKCDGKVEGGTWCNKSKDHCENRCGGGVWCTSETKPSLAPVASPPTPDGVKTATTTRYWDCSGGACGCSYVPKGLDNPDEPAMCHSNAMFEAPPSNPYGAKYYGTAAISSDLGGGDWMAKGCGKCWKVTGSANIKKYENVGETTMVIKGTNFCPSGNPLCAAGPHFDISAPGFDVLQYSFANTCPKREAKEKKGFAACGKWMIDNQNPDKNCDCSKFNSPVLRAGCENFYALKWDNSPVVYEELDKCPPELSSLHCGYPYPDEKNMPETCASNVSELEPTKAPVSLPPQAPANCPTGWKSASWTWFQSYAPCCKDSPNYDPDYPTLECDLYSACRYLGQFAYSSGTRDYDYVSKNNIIAFFSTHGDNKSYGNKQIKIKAGSKTITASVLDTCGDSDCDGCCSKNAAPSGYLVDMESHTVERYFGSLDEAYGEVCWKLVDKPPTGYCSWYKCNGEIQKDPYCNFDSHNCLGVCGGKLYCQIGPTDAPAPSPPTSKQPTPKEVPCVNLKRPKCKKECFWTKKPRKIKSCFPKKDDFEHDCSLYTNGVSCTLVSVCKFANNKCFHTCDGLARKKCIQDPYCKLSKIRNPCLGCQLASTCNSRR